MNLYLFEAISKNRIGYRHRYRFFKVISVTSVTYRLIGIGMGIGLESLHTDTDLSNSTAKWVLAQ